MSAIFQRNFNSTFQIYLCEFLRHKNGETRQLLLKIAKTLEKVDFAVWNVRQSAAKLKGNREKVKSDRDRGRPTRNPKVSRCGKEKTGSSTFAIDDGEKIFLFSVIVVVYCALWSWKFCNRFSPKEFPEKWKKTISGGERAWDGQNYNNYITNAQEHELNNNFRHWNCANGLEMSEWEVAITPTLPQTKSDRTEKSSEKGGFRAESPLPPFPRVGPWLRKIKINSKMVQKFDETQIHGMASALNWKLPNFSIAARTDTEHADSRILRQLWIFYGH